MGFIDNLRSLPPVTKNLLIINTLVWLAMEVLPPVSGFLAQYGALYYFSSDQFIATQLLSYMFIHSGFVHLFFNMFALFMFGVTIERVLGSQRFLFYYLSCGIGAALVQEGVFAIMLHHYASAFENSSAVLTVMSQTSIPMHELWDIGVESTSLIIAHIYGLLHTPTVGASGAIFGILLAFGYMFPNVRLYLIFPPIPMRARVFVLLYAGLELVLGIANSQADTVAHFAHLGGMLFGLLILLYWRKKHVIGGPYF